MQKCVKNKTLKYPDFPLTILGAKQLLNLFINYKLDKVTLVFELVKVSPKRGTKEQLIKPIIKKTSYIKNDQSRAASRTNFKK